MMEVSLQFKKIGYATVSSRGAFPSSPYNSRRFKRVQKI